MSFETNVTNLAQRTANEAKALRTLINGNASDLSGLSTVAKSNLVAAVNELYDAMATLTGDPASETAAGVVELATTTEATTGTDTVRAVTPAGLKASVDAAIAALAGTAPEALNTLGELSDALADDPNFATTVTTALGNRVRTDTAAQGLDATQQANARTNIDVYSKAEIGDINKNFVTTFEAGLV